MSETTMPPADHPCLKAWTFPELSPAEFDALGTTPSLDLAQLNYLAGFALLAPTTHNTLPQRLRVNDSTSSIEVLVDRTRILPESDPHGRQALVSMGCVIANLELAAGALGKATRVELAAVDPSLYAPLSAVEHPETLIPVAEVFFSEGSDTSSAPWLALMRERKVVRAEYDAAVSLDPELLSKLQECVHGCSEHVKLETVTKRIALRGLGKFQEQADRFVFENKSFARELGEWLLPNGQLDQPSAMRGYEFGFDDDFAREVHRGLLGEIPLLPDQVAGFARGARAGLESSSAVFVLTTAGDTVLERVHTGRVGQRLMLRLQQAGFCSAVHAALTEVEWVSKIFSATVLRSRRRPMMLFRTGQVKRPQDAQRPHAARPALAAILRPF